MLLACDSVRPESARKLTACVTTPVRKLTLITAEKRARLVIDLVKTIAHLVQFGRHKHCSPECNDLPRFTDL